MLYLRVVFACSSTAMYVIGIIPWHLLMTGHVCFVGISLHLSPRLPSLHLEEILCVGVWRLQNWNEVCILKHWILRKVTTSWRMPSYEMLRRVALVRTDVSEESSAFIIRVTRIGELEPMLAVTSNRILTLALVHRFLSPWWWRL
jgi:hypothetical protein